MGKQTIGHDSPGGQRFPRERVIAHRGLWSASVPRNSREALSAAAGAGLGIETDIRDSPAGIVVSHDPPGIDHAATLLSFLEMVRESSRPPGVIALNVKSDGLLSFICDFTSELERYDFFFFDMSVPELLQYSRSGLPVAVRMSEYEPYDLALSQHIGRPIRIWLDSFVHDWFTSSGSVAHILESASVAVVSPEIHGRDPRWVWDWVWGCHRAGHTVSICTDHPLEFLRWESGH